MKHLNMIVLDQINFDKCAIRQLVKIYLVRQIVRYCKHVAPCGAWTGFGPAVLQICPLRGLTGFGPAGATNMSPPAGLDGLRACRCYKYVAPCGAWTGYGPAGATNMSPLRGLDRSFP